MGFPKSVPWLEESASPLLAGYCHWTSLSGPGQSRWRHHNWSSGERRAQCQRAEECLQVEQTKRGSTSPPRSPEPMPEFALPPGFKEVMACLQREPLPLTASEVPMEPMQPEVIVEPVVAMVCASHTVQDEAMGITYMDTVTTSVG